jgi:predicted hotdog family 3-hydroxylacyl-ACP dehydratase
MTEAHTTFALINIAQLIPHRGTMCILDRVQHYDAHHIRCHTKSHRNPENPLKENGRIHSVCGIEYAAQAMALHGALTSRPTSQPRSGRLAGVRMVEFHVSRLDDVQEDLVINASLLMGDVNNMVYEFNIDAGSQLLLKGKATVILLS